MRTGKSKAVIDKACYNFRRRRINGCMVFAPNGVHMNWLINEIPKWSGDDISWKGVAWETPKLGDPLFQRAVQEVLDHNGMKWLCVNMQALIRPECKKAIKEFMRVCRGKFMMAISEAHHFGHGGAGRSGVAYNISRHARFVTIETGTPILNSPLRAYAIFKILMGGLGGEFILDDTGPFGSYEDYARHICVIVDDEALKKKFPRLRRQAYRKIKCYKNLDEIRGYMAPYCSVVMRSDVEDMPELMRDDRFSSLSEAQRRAYLELAARHLVELEETNDMVAAPDGGPRMMKLQQILMGYIKDTDNDKIISIEDDAPIYRDILEEVVGNQPGKSLIWFRYREDIRRFATLCIRKGLKPLEFHGGVPMGQREATRLAFKNDPQYNPLIGQPATGAEGLDFSSSVPGQRMSIIFGSSTPNAIHVTQGEERGTVKAGEAVNIIRMRFRGTVDDRNWDIVDGKTTLADTMTGAGMRALLRSTDL